LCQNLQFSILSKICQTLVSELEPARKESRTRIGLVRLTCAVSK
jgi:hypothetical protein